MKSLFSFSQTFLLVGILLLGTCSCQYKDLSRQNLKTKSEVKQRTIVKKTKSEKNSNSEVKRNKSKLEEPLIVHKKNVDTDINDADFIKILRDNGVEVEEPELIESKLK